MYGVRFRLLREPAITEIDYFTCMVEIADRQTGPITSIGSDESRYTVAR